MTENKGQKVRKSRGAQIDVAVHWGLLIAALVAVIVVFFILGFLLKEGLPFFTHVGVGDFLLGNHWNPVGEPPYYGAYPIIVGTLLVSLGAIAFAVPLGIGTAIFIAEVAPPRLRFAAKASVELLSGIPSVVFGFFGLIVLTDWLRVAFDRPTGESWLAGSIILGIMALPTIVSVSEDAITSVPRDFREASLAMGATKWQTIRRVVVPAAMSGITAAIILGIGRAIGETMAVMMVTGNAAILPQPITDVFSPLRTITGTLAIEMGEVSVGSLHYSALFALALVLFVIVLCVNMAANYVMRRLNEKFKPTKKGVAMKKKSFKFPKLLQDRWQHIAIVFAFAIMAWLFVSWFGVLFGIIGLCAIAAVYFASGRMSPKAAQRSAYAMLLAFSLSVAFMLGIILYYIVSNGAGAISWTFLTQPPKDIGRAGGIYPAIVGTLYLVGGAILLAVPLGVLAGIYLSEYSKDSWLTRLIRAGIDNLNGTPSIVFGLFGFAFFVLFLGFGISMLAGQLTLAFMILPTIIRTTEEAVKAVPQGLREGSLALGSSKWQSIMRVVLPQATPGIITGTILSIGRAAGETAPILFTAAVFSQRFLPSSVFDPVMALPYHLFVLSTSVPGSQHAAYGTALVLLLVVMAFYAVAMVIRHKYGRKKI
jgi:phosphate transport system permease protein